jgi:hypothetical protein
MRRKLKRLDAWQLRCSTAICGLRGCVLQIRSRCTYENHHVLFSAERMIDSLALWKITDSFDLGVSSPQLDDARRGFSRTDDLRHAMNPQAGSPPPTGYGARRKMKSRGYP